MEKSQLEILQVRNDYIKNYAYYVINDVVAFSKDTIVGNISQTGGPIATFSGQ